MVGVCVCVCITDEFMPYMCVLLFSYGFSQTSLVLLIFPSLTLCIDLLSPSPIKSLPFQIFSLLSSVSFHFPL